MRPPPKSNPHKIRRKDRLRSCCLSAILALFVILTWQEAGGSLRICMRAVSLRNVLPVNT